MFLETSLSKRFMSLRLGVSPSSFLYTTGGNDTSNILLWWCHGGVMVCCRWQRGGGATEGKAEGGRQKAVDGRQ